MLKEEKTDFKVVSLVDITKKYHNIIFKNVYLDIFAGDCLAILGKNNAGKTTLAKLIANVEQPTSGVVKFFLKESSSIGFQFLSYNWPVGIKVKDLIILYCGIYQVSINGKWVQDLIKLVNFQNNLKKNLSKLKNFEKELLTFLLALIHQPKLVILDEIATNLTFDLIIKVFDFLKLQLINKSITLVIINPTSTQIETLCNRVVWIKDHNIVEVKVNNILQEHSNFKQYLFSKLKEYY